MKTPDVAYGDIPLPFGEMHTENIASTDLVRAAVVAQLAKPAVTPSTFWQISSTFKYNVLTWIGIVGNAITLFANLKGSPLHQLTRRLGLVVLGVLTLIGLSEVSKLNLPQYLQPPKVSDNSVR